LREASTKKGGAKAARTHFRIPAVAGVTHFLSNPSYGLENDVT
jgi:hypothetical protein